MLGQPALERVGVLHRALAKAEMRADLRPVVLDRPPRPLVGAELARRDLDLAGDELHHVGRQLSGRLLKYPAYLREGVITLAANHEACRRSPRIRWY